MVKKAENTRKQNRLLPVIGLVLGLALALVSYVLVPTVKDFLIRQGVIFGGLSPAAIDLLVGAAIWVSLFGIGMFIVSAAIGTHHDDKVAREYYKRSAKRKERERREQEMKRRRRQQMRQNRSDTTRRE